jgi:hypothetical protein
MESFLAKRVHRYVRGGEQLLWPSDKHVEFEFVEQILFQQEKDVLDRVVGIVFLRENINEILHGYQEVLLHLVLRSFSLGLLPSEIVFQRENLLYLVQYQLTFILPDSRQPVQGLGEIQVPRAVVYHGLSNQSLLPGGPSDFLDVVRNASARRMVVDDLDVFDVYPHSKGFRGEHNLDLSRFEIVQVDFLGLLVELSVVGSDLVPESVGGQLGMYFPYMLFIREIHQGLRSHVVVFLDGENRLFLALEIVIPAIFKFLELESDIIPDDVSDVFMGRELHVKAVHGFENHVVLSSVHGRRRQRQHHELFLVLPYFPDVISQVPVVHPEIPSPRGYQMCLVDNEQSQFPFPDEMGNVVGQEQFGREVQDRDFSILYFIDNLFPFLQVLLRVYILRVGESLFLQGADLIVHQGD